MTQYVVDFEIDFPESIARDAPDNTAFAGIVKLPTMLRTQSIRFCMFSCITKIAEHPESAESARKGAARALTGYHRIMSVLVGRAPLPELHAGALDWARSVVDTVPNTLPVLTEFGQRADRVISAFDAGQIAPARAIEDMVNYGYSEFHYRAVELTEAMRGAYEEIIAKEKEAARAARGAAQSAVDRIDTISRTVRLIAVNASVEAARAGDSGRGFTVIAQEIKSLSEATEAASKDVRYSIDGIMDSLRL